MEHVSQKAYQLKKIHYLNQAKLLILANFGSDICLGKSDDSICRYPKIQQLFQGHDFRGFPLYNKCFGNSLRKQNYDQRKGQGFTQKISKKIMIFMCFISYN